MGPTQIVAQARSVTYVVWRGVNDNLNKYCNGNRRTSHSAALKTKGIIEIGYVWKTSDDHSCGGCKWRGGDHLKLSPCCPQKLTHKTWTSPFLHDWGSNEEIQIGIHKKMAIALEWKVSDLSPTDSVLVALSFYGPSQANAAIPQCKRVIFHCYSWFYRGYAEHALSALYINVCILCGLPKLCI